MDDLISRQALLTEYDRLHVGEPGRARKLIEDAPSVTISNQTDDLKVTNCNDSDLVSGQTILNLPSAQPERKAGRWIPCSERLPEEPNVYVVTNSNGDVVRFAYTGTESSREYWLRCAKAWQPLPEPYREEK